MPWGSLECGHHHEHLTLPGGEVGTPYSVNLTYTSTSPPAIFFQISSGSLPPAAGSYTFTIRVAEAQSDCIRYHPDNVPNDTYATLTITIAGPITITITTTSLPAITQGSPYSQTLAATGGSGQLNWTASGLPAGLTLSLGGVLSGTPSASGVFPIQFTVTDTCTSTASATIGLTINPAVAITTAELAF